VQPFTGCGGQKALLLSHSDGSSAAVYLQGAHVTSYRGADHIERLFTSSRSHYAASKAIRGGIPLCFPQFGGRGSLPSHGFFRNVDWQLVSSNTDGASCSVILSLHSSESTLKLWPHDFEATCSVTLSGCGQLAAGADSSTGSLTVAVSIRNLSGSSMSVTGALHSYFRVGAIERTSVILDARDYEDNLAGGAVCAASSPVTFAAEVDRVYGAAVASEARADVWCRYSVARQNSLESNLILVVDAARSSTVRVLSQQPDAVVWNPWVTKCKVSCTRQRCHLPFRSCMACAESSALRALLEAHSAPQALADIRDDDFLQFVCVESGTVRAPATGSLFLF
jgi:glucose-6-phosphate 1-epimerase